MMSDHTPPFRFPALEISQGPHRTIYSFAIDGKLLDQIATVSRIRRNGATLEGYQRPEVLSHIAEIRAYIESADAMIPNAVVIAFNSQVFFESDTIRKGVGTLVVPTPIAGEPLPGFVVDGQQRLAAIRDARVPAFPVAVNAFITDDLREQTEQFILVNSTKPLPKGLIYELLPGTRVELTSHLRRRRFPSTLLDRLNRDQDSPLVGRIQTPTMPGGAIKDNSILRMLENSLSDGALFRYAGRGERPPDSEQMLLLLKAFWSAVATVFSDAWTLPPKRSRLTHGVGIIAMGFLMDACADRVRGPHPPDQAYFERELRPLASVTHWTDGFWEFGPGQLRRWNELQNTSPDIQILTNHLIGQYRGVQYGRAPHN